MADFSYLSDTDDSAVEELIQQANDLCVLEQVSKINCSGFTDNDLPLDLDSRFRRLKSLPVSRSSNEGKSVKSLKSKHASFRQFDDGPDEKDLNLNLERLNLDAKKSVEGNSRSGPESFLDSDESLDQKIVNLKKPKKKMSSEKKKIVEGFSDSDESLNEKNVNLKKPKKKKLSEKKSVESFLDSDENLDEKIVNLKATKKKLSGKKSVEGNSRFGCESFLDSDESFEEKNVNLKPKKKSAEGISRFGCESFSGFDDHRGDCSSISSLENEVSSTSKPSRSAKKGRSTSSSGRPSSVSPPKSNCWPWCSPKKSSGKKNVDFLKEQEKILKKAMKEQERIDREMEKLVKLAKQASARIVMEGLDDELSNSDGR